MADKKKDGAAAGGGGREGRGRAEAPAQNAPYGTDRWGNPVTQGGFTPDEDYAPGQDDPDYDVYEAMNPNHKHGVSRLVDQAIGLVDADYDPEEVAGDYIWDTEIHITGTTMADTVSITMDDLYTEVARVKFGADLEALSGDPYWDMVSKVSPTVKRWVFGPAGLEEYG